ncbi:hypothetical protein SAMN05428642_102644 [Flaviramulus basaltis]|uniref:Uncharacterized protein n=1 Tax=Flaviramulus basaltis TaxID=369401 RepID=A0A1K2IJ31_9FLAO|nr:hypothetical protein SAMN05428642_102644 [Flaviramulus basaltis]
MLPTLMSIFYYKLNYPIKYEDNLINNPSIIMGDEPKGNLNSHNSENVFNIFEQLSNKQD